MRTREDKPRKALDPLGEALRWIRLEYLGGISQPALAKEVGVTPGCINMWENGKRTPADRYLVQLANRVAKSQEERPAILYRLRMGLVQRQMPEVIAGAERKYLRLPSKGPEADMWAAWRRDVTGRLTTLGLTVADLAEKAGVKRPHLDEALRGWIFLPPVEVRRLAEALGADPKRQLLLVGYVPEEVRRAKPDVAAVLAADLGLDKRGEMLLGEVMAGLMEEEADEGHGNA